MIGDWDIERKDELLSLARVIVKDENVLLRHKLRTYKADLAVPILAEIIAQGVKEGVFETAYVKESAEIYFAISRVFSETIMDIFLNPENYDDPITLTRQKFDATQIAIERVLGAETGSLPLIDEEKLTAWFEK